MNKSLQHQASPRTNRNRKYIHKEREKQQERRGYSSNKPAPSSRTTQVYTASFQTMHLKCQSIGTAAKYKAHKPGCKCQKMRKRLEASIACSADDGDQLECDQDASTLDILSTLDGLIVHPDTKGFGCIFLCRYTSHSIYAENHLSTELVLKEKIFSFFSAPSIIKVNCAACLLEHEPNGFACVISSNSDVIDLVRDATSRRIEMKRESIKGLHSDHGDFLLRLPQSLLWKLKQNKTRKSGKQVRDEVLSHMANQGIHIYQGSEHNVELKIGHHLDSLIHQMSSSSSLKKDKNKCRDHRQDPCEEKYWLLYGFDHTKEHKVSFELSVPGGKRHLGETCMEAAIRETEEETSLIWDERWITNVYQNKRNSSEKFNRYFSLSPPDPWKFIEEINEFQNSN
jgi:hypothetical protein